MKTELAWGWSGAVAWPRDRRECHPASPSMGTDPGPAESGRWGSPQFGDHCMRKFKERCCLSSTPQKELGIQIQITRGTNLCLGITAVNTLLKLDTEAISCRRRYWWL